MVVGDYAKIEMTSKNGSSSITPKIDEYWVLLINRDSAEDFAGGFLSHDMLIIAYYSKPDKVIVFIRLDRVDPEVIG